MEEFLIHSIRTLWNLAHEFETLASSPIREQVSPPTRYLLQDCKLGIEQERKRLLVEAPTRVTALALIRLRSRKRELAILAQTLELNWVTIYFEGAELMSFEGKK